MFRCDGEMEESKQAFDEVCEPVFLVIKAVSSELMARDSFVGPSR